MKNLLLIATLAFLATGVMAQQGLHLGIKGAPQSTWMLNGDDMDDPNWLFENTVRASFGASFAYFFSDKVGLGIDLLYSAQGQKFEFETQGITGNGFTNLNYFKIPLLFHYHSNAESTALFYLNVGPQFSFLTSGQSQGTIQVPFVGDVVVNATNKDNYESMNIGAVLALGAGFNITDFLMLTAGLRLDFAFSDAEDKSFGFYSLDSDRRPNHNATAGFEIGLRYVLRTN
jgi:hypothetical protein